MALPRTLMVWFLFVAFCAHVAFAQDPTDVDVRDLDGGVDDRRIQQTNPNWNQKPKNPCYDLLRHIKFLTYKLDKHTNQVHKIPFDIFESQNTKQCNCFEKEDRMFYHMIYKFSASIRGIPEDGKSICKPRSLIDG
ncbi:hypothetical protein LOTGIDRAFT_162564 [Lottia gigantea]|uniref:Uncharacterized protein n=1 Tax=Lottia gigantea TaxID=225164 RepID=V4BUC0_LOTGI|nr:hypothetical protein LOTGIDRAFT_162564 [Lottia gigantea]ESO92644.1 hypothetical protein LOTGIDRAFT_162564 [Lottia gigantea]